MNFLVVAASHVTNCADQGQKETWRRIYRISLCMCVIMLPGGGGACQ